MKIVLYSQRPFLSSECLKYEHNNRFFFETDDPDKQLFTADPVGKNNRSPVFHSV